MDTGKRRRYSDTQKELTSTQESDEDAVQHDTKCNIKGNREEIKHKLSTDIRGRNATQ